MPKPRARPASGRLGYNERVSHGVRVHFLGTGTPLGLTGLYQACVLIATDGHKVLLDCGMTALASLGRAGIDPREIDAVLISHLHGDHFGGLAPLLLDASLRPRHKPLTIAGPAGTQSRVAESLEIFGWASASAVAAEFVQLDPAGEAANILGWEVTSLAVPHNPATAPTGLRVAVNGVVIGYSGDAGWSQSLVDLAKGADLFICGVWSWNDARDASFIDMATLTSRRAELQCRRLLLTHLGPEVLQRLGEAAFEVATDGLVLEL